MISKILLKSFRIVWVLFCGLHDREEEEAATQDFVEVLQSSLWISSPEHAGWLTKRTSNWVHKQVFATTRACWQLYYRLVVAIVEAEDGSVCFNNCSGHGKCIDYSCHCFIGYHGDDCSTSFVQDENNIIPILSAGHMNITRQNFTAAVSQHPFLLIGFSSYACHKCIRAEVEYAKISDRLKELKIPFVRGNADKMKSIVTELGALELPSLVFMKKMRPTVYKGVHEVNAVLQYVKKQLQPPVKKLQTLSEFEDFKALRHHSDYSLSTVIVVGLFTDYKDIEEDEYEEFMEVAKSFQSNEDLYFGMITTNRTIINSLKQSRVIDRTPSVYLLASDVDTPRTMNLDELYNVERGGLKEWILQQSIPLVGRMTPQNFLLYEKQQLPMLLMFLNLTNERELSHQPGRIVGGRSGGILNEVLIEELRVAAKEHQHRIVCVYLDGTLYEDQMKLLGLYGGKERLPSLAFNTRDGKQLPFPEELPINADTLLQFMADYVSGKLQSLEDTKAMARKALQRAIPLNTKNQAVRLEKKAIPASQQGVSEHFGDGLKGDQAIFPVTLRNFQEVVLLDDSRDIVLYLYSRDCQACAHFNVYFKRMADRFQALAISSVLITRMDVTEETPPAELNLINGPLPLLVMIPANQKTPPWTYYSGVGKIQPMMKWIHEHVSIPFELENLPHLSESDKIAYKEQVREREIALEKKRKEEQRQMEREEREKKELLRKKRKAEKAAAAAAVNNGNKEERVSKEEEEFRNDEF